MSGRVGSITTGIIEDGLVLNLDPANRSSYITNALTGSNTIDSTQIPLQGPTYISAPVSASCWNFDGIDDTINSMISFKGNATMGGWLKTTYTGASDSFYYVNNTFAFGSGFYAGGGYWLGRLWATYGDQDRLVVMTGGASNWGTTGTTQLNDGNWHYVVWSFDTSSFENSAYVNGVLESYKVVPTLIPINSFTYKAGDFLAGTNRYWKGEIANMHVYNRVLSSNEVLHNYNALKGRFS